jgi:hypothetical protein
MTTKPTPCPGCAAALPPGYLACKACYFAKVPSRIRDEMRAESAHCKKIGVAHTQRLLQIQGIIKRLFIPAPTAPLFKNDQEAL